MDFVDAVVIHYFFMEKLSSSLTVCRVAQRTEATTAHIFKLRDMIFGTLQCGFVLNTCELCTDQTYNTKWCHKHAKTFRHCEDGDSQT